MKYVPSPLIGRLSKSAGSITAAYNKFGSYLRNRVTPTNPNTSFQTAVRGDFATYAGEYRNLTASQQEAWIQLGKNIERQDSLGQTYSLTGLQAYMLININRGTVGSAGATDAPALQLPDAAPTFSAVVDASPENFTFTFGTIPTGEFMLVYATRPVSAGRAFASTSEFKLISVFDDTASSPEILVPAYTDRFGTIAGKAGEKVFIRVIMVNAEGFASTPVQTSVVIVP